MRDNIKELARQLRLAREPIRHTAADALEALAGEVERWKKNHEALQDKIGCMKSCGCAYDAAGDICGHHSPKLIAAEAERDRLAGEVERVTKELDVSWEKRKIWINGFNEQSALAASAEAERDRLKAALDIAKDHAKQNQRARDLVSPYPNDHAKRIVWEKALYHEGKGLWAKLRKALGDAS